MADDDDAEIDPDDWRILSSWAWRTFASRKPEVVGPWVGGSATATGSAHEPPQGVVVAFGRAGATSFVDRCWHRDLGDPAAYSLTQFTLVTGAMLVTVVAQHGDADLVRAGSAVLGEVVSVLPVVLAWSGPTRSTWPPVPALDTEAILRVSDTAASLWRAAGLE